jgi:hypothetical protein
MLIPLSPMNPIASSSIREVEAAPTRTVGSVQFPKPIPPKLYESPLLYNYVTCYGNYSFLKFAPFVFRYRSDVDVMPLSLFWIEASQQVSVDSFSVAVKTDTRFLVNVTLNLNRGYLATDFQFFSDKPPKITVSFRKGSGWNLGDYQIVWFSITYLKWVRTWGMANQEIPTGSTVRYGSVTRIGLSNSSIVFADRYLNMDWSDYGLADCFIGRFAVGGFNGVGVYIKFPANIAKIDPVVHTSDDSTSLTFGGKSKTHWDGTRYWQAYRNSTHACIESSADGVNWANAPIDLGLPVWSGSVRVSNFVFSGTTIHYTWGDADARSGGSGVDVTLIIDQHYRRGVIAGAVINFDPIRTLFTWTVIMQADPNFEFYLKLDYSDIALRTDNQLAVMFSGRGYVKRSGGGGAWASRYFYKMLNSTVSDGSGWTAVSTLESDFTGDWDIDDDNLAGAGFSISSYYIDTRPLLAPLAATKMICYNNRDGVLRRHTSNAWGSFTTVDGTVKDVNSFGSVAGGDGGGKTLAVWVDSDDTVDGEWTNNGASVVSITNLFAATATSPTVCSNNVTNAAWYAFTISGGNSIQWLACSQYNGSWDSAAHTFAAGLVIPVDLSSSRTILHSRVLICWQSENAPNYNVNFNWLTPPNAPVLTAPAADAYRNMGGAVVYTWTFSDPDPTETQSAYQFQLDNDPAFGSPEVDTGKVVSALGTTTQNLPNTVGTYYWRVRTWDNTDCVGPYSAPGRRIYSERIEWYQWDCTDSDHLVGRNTAARVWVRGRWQTDNAAFTNAGGNTVTINATLATWDAVNLYWYADFTVNAVASRVFVVSAFNDGVRAITVSTDTGGPITVTWTDITLGVSVNAAAGTHNAQVTLTGTWAHNATAVNNGNFRLYNVTHLVVQGNSTGAGSVTLTVPWTLHAAGSFIANGSRWYGGAGIVVFTPLNPAYSITGFSLQTTWAADFQLSVGNQITVRFWNTATFPAASNITIENCKIRFRLSTGGGAICCESNSSLFDVAFSTQHSGTYTFTPTGTPTSGFYDFRVTVFGTGSDVILLDATYSVYVTVPGGAAGPPPSGGGGGVAKPPWLLSMVDLSDSALAGQTITGSFTVKITGTPSLMLTKIESNVTWLSFDPLPKEPFQDSTELPWTATIPLDTPTGKYLIRITVTGSDGDKSVSSFGYLTIDVVSTLPVQPWTENLGLIILGIAVAVLILSGGTKGRIRRTHRARQRVFRPRRRRQR